MNSNSIKHILFGLVYHVLHNELMLSHDYIDGLTFSLFSVEP